MRKTFLAPLLSLVVISVLAACSGVAAETKSKESVIGEWVGQSSGITMYATISANAIQINLKTEDDTTSLYWLGTFDTSKDASKDFTTTSLGDQDAMAKSIFGSQSKTKDFTYKDSSSTFVNGKVTYKAPRLSFKFSILGTTTNIRMHKK